MEKNIFDWELFKNDIINEIEKRIEIFYSNLNNIRSNMILVNVVSEIILDDKSKKKIKSVSSVRSESGKLVIKPFEKKNFSIVIKYVLNSGLGYNLLEGNKNDNELFFVLSPMTKETKNNLVEKAKEESEKARISIRLIRQKFNNFFKSGNKEKKISDNQKNVYLGKIDSLVKDYQKKIDIIEKQKKDEIIR